MCSDFVQISFLGQAERLVSHVGLLEDVSPDGMCLNLDLPVPTGQTVQVHTKGFEGKARVSYCHLGEYGYQAGLEFVDGCSWDRETWQPKHLLTDVKAS